VSQWQGIGGAGWHVLDCRVCVDAVTNLPVIPVPEPANTFNDGILPKVLYTG
jgi:hypothetical protein